MSRKYKYPSSQVNNIGNYMFLEKTLNIQKTNRMPEEYFPEATKDQPEFFTRNIVPSDPNLHKPENFVDFLNVRRKGIFEIVSSVLTYRD